MFVMSSFLMNATTASGNFVSVGLNPNGTLEQKSALVVLNGERMVNFRESSSRPGWYSLDQYERAPDGWDFLGEHRQKLRPDELPLPPMGAYHHAADGVRYRTILPMDGAARNHVDGLSKTKRGLRRRRR
jgi:hypothetical protein